MALKDLFSRITGPDYKETVALEDYVELQIPEGEFQAAATGRFVKVCKLNGFADVDIVVRELSDGNIVVLDIKPLAERSMNELRHAVDEVKDICISMGGDIAGLSEYHLIITPPSVKIDREPGSRAKGFEEAVEKIRKQA